MRTEQTVVTQSEITAFQRFEVKYIISENQAQAIRNLITPYVIPDPFAKKDASYPIYSMYLDSPDMKLYWMSELGVKNRFKLRVRWYDEQGGAPVFLEIKRRLDSIIKKERKKIQPEFLPKFLQRQMDISDLPIPLDGADMDHILLFFNYMRRLNARPRVLVRYMREAYVSRQDHSTRITFDRGLQCVPAIACNDLKRLGRNIWYSVPFPTVILELKFNDVYPEWVQKMIRRTSLSRDSVAKYLIAVKEMNKLGFRFEY